MSGPVRIVRKVAELGQEFVFRADEHGTVWSARVQWVPVLPIIATVCGTDIPALRAELTESSALHQELTEGGEGANDSQV